MNHLPLPKNSSLKPIEVPYRCTSDYDGGPMLEYPNRRGWKIKYSPYGIRYFDENGNKPSNAELESFIQTWLYFGFLHELFSDFTDIKSFVAEDKQVITTAPLQDCLDALFKRWEGYTKSQEPDDLLAIQSASQLNTFVGKVSLNTKSLLRNEEVDERIWLSIAVLCETVERIRTNHFLKWDDDDPGELNTTWRAHGNPPLARFLVDEMVQNGWCPFDVDRIDKTATSATLLYYLAHLPPPRPNADHSLCTPDVCTSMAIDSSYRPRHASTDCQCSSEFSDTASVIKALQGDEIPLVQEVLQVEMIEKPAEEPGAQGSWQLVEATTVDPRFQIIESGEEQQFVAISHVWAEGLGNPNSNSLPACTLKWISDKASEFLFRDDYPVQSQEGDSFRMPSARKIPFWIDTLCVPISPPEMWTKAMNRLRKPYQDASLVLILDSYLYTQDTKDIDAIEIWARILCCSWSRRLWTFQEARLARPGRLCVLFKDRMMTMEDIWLKFSESLATEELTTELYLKWRGSNTIRGLAETGAPVTDWILQEFRAEPDIWDMRESLKARAVSVPSDEVLCLFCNMGMDMALVMRTPPEERLAVFWRNVKKIPVGLVFSTAPEKMTVPGLRWAPTSFLGNLDRVFWYIEQCLRPRMDGFVTEHGLQIQVPAMMCDPNLLLWDESFEVAFESDNTVPMRDEKNEWYFVEAREFWNQERTERPKANERLAILHVQNIEDLDSPSTGVMSQTPGDPFDFPSSMQAVLGIVEDPISSQEDTDEEGTQIISEAVRVLDRPSDTPNPRDLLRFRGYRHLRLHRFSDAMSSYHRAVAAAVELFVAICGYRMLCTDDSGNEVDLLSILFPRKPDNNATNATEEVAGDSDAKSEESGGSSKPASEIEGGEELVQNLKDLEIDQASADAEQRTEVKSPVHAVENEPEGSGPDEQSMETETDDDHDSGTDGAEDAESDEETPDTYTLTDGGRERCQKFANKFARFDERVRKITLEVGANLGRDEEESYDHFAKSARFQLQMRRRNGMKRLKRETWWLID